VLTSWTQARFNVPYVGGSSRRGKTDDSHQAIQGVGTDSLDLIVAGWRLAGHREVSFVGPFLLEPAHESRTTVQVTRGRPEGEHFITPTGDQIAVGPDSVIPGDILRSSRQAGVFARDLPPMGVLSDNDMVVTALFEEPRLLSIRDSLAGPITVLRWNELRELQLDLKLLRHFEGEIDGVASPQLLSAIKSIRSAAGLPPLQNEGGLAGLEKRWGTLQAVPPVARFSVFWKEHERLKLDPVDERAMLQRLVAQLSEAMGNPAEDGFVLTPPRKGMQAPLTARTADQPFLPQQASFWQLETAVPLIAQTFVVGDANRDGKVDATGVPAEVLAPGPGVILEAEGTWKGKRKPERVSLYGNQVWIYLPRVDVLLGYLGLGTVPVKVGDVVKTGAVLGTVGRTGELGSSRKSPTQLRVVAFTGAKEGQFLPIDPASLWGLKVEEQLLPARRFVSSPPVVLSGEDPASSISPSDVPPVAPSAVSSPQTSPAEAPVGTPHER
jgi:hypothetical protein